MKTAKNSGSTTAPSTQAPEPVNFRVGCKVMWNYYKTREEAEIAAQHARAEARERAAQGFDFGYCAPGSIEFKDPERYPNSEYKGLYEVCFP